MAADSQTFAIVLLIASSCFLGSACSKTKEPVSTLNQSISTTGTQVSTSTDSQLQKGDRPSPNDPASGQSLVPSDDSSKLADAACNNPIPLPDSSLTEIKSLSEVVDKNPGRYELKNVLIFVEKEQQIRSLVKIEFQREGLSLQANGKLLCRKFLDESNKDVSLKLESLLPDGLSRVTGALDLIHSLKVSLSFQEDASQTRNKGDFRIETNESQGLYLEEHLKKLEGEFKLYRLVDRANALILRNKFESQEKGVASISSLYILKD